MYNYQDFAKAVYAELDTELSFAEWDDQTFFSSDPMPPEMSFCERWFIVGETEYPYVLGDASYILVQLSCTDGQWEIFTSDQMSTSVIPYSTEAEARAAWSELLGA